MKDCDIAIVGAGLAGSTAAAMLGKAGYSSVALVDPHDIYPAEFRCEKLDASQVALLRKTGLAEPVLRQATLDGVVTIARYGRVLETKRSGRYGIIYDMLVNAVRGQIPASVSQVRAKVTGIANSADRQILMLSTGEELSARLVVMANGLHPGLAQSLGIERRVVSRGHTVAIGFDLRPTGRSSFGFKALTCYPEKVSNGVAYMSIFGAGGTHRVNMFTYWKARDPHRGNARRSGSDARRAVAETAEPPRRLRRRERPHPADRPLRHRGLPATRHRARGRRLRHRLPGGRSGGEQGLDRRRAPLQRAHPALARLAGHGHGEARELLRRPDQACVRRELCRPRVSPALTFYRRGAGLARATLDAVWRPDGGSVLRRASVLAAALLRDHKLRRNAATGQVSENLPMPR